MVTRDMEQQMHDYLGDIAAETKNNAMFRYNWLPK